MYKFSLNKAKHFSFSLCCRRLKSFLRINLNKSLLLRMNEWLLKMIWWCVTKWFQHQSQKCTKTKNKKVSQSRNTWKNGKLQTLKCYCLNSKLSNFCLNKDNEYDNIMNKIKYLKTNSNKMGNIYFVYKH